MAIWECPKLWDGGEAWIIGGGPSMPRQFGVPEEIIKEVMTQRVGPNAYSQYLTPLHNKHVIGVNNAFKIGNWIDAIFFGDCAWYCVYRLALAELATLKVTCCDRFQKPDKSCNGIRYLPRDRKKNFGITDDPTKVSWNNNSGTAAINVAAHFGVKRIILLGFDMTLDGNQISHWFGSHRPRDKRPPRIPFDRHLKGFPYIAEDAKRLSIEILNASPVSRIVEFPKVEVKDLL